MSASEIITGTISGPARLDKALAEATGLSRARVQGLGLSWDRVVETLCA